ncbi:hypothetical protein J0X15_17255 [Roseibium sp. CAU 1637]|uniref:Uncharacterized protein n=1 Tax=Roseibium limicola TaxID=2816037 RepID=A0A939EQZ3_9HYPH|nr:hypothetical protein [Roseibium limicola]MBO0346977.1 hypothetical protein [Roseibium limicola]
MTRTKSKIVLAFATALMLGGTAMGVSTTAASAQSAVSKIEDGKGRVLQIDHRGSRHGYERGGRRDERGGRGHVQRGHGRDHVLGKRQVRRSLRRQGYRDIRFVGQRGPVFIVRAKGWRGLPQRLVVDARSAAVIGRKPVRQGGYNWSYRW